MTAPAVQQEDPLLRLRYYRETGQVDEAKHYEDYLHSTGQLTASTGAPPKPDGATKLHAEYKAGTLAPRMASENAQEAATDPTIGTELLGTAASLARDVPGAEAAQALFAKGASHVPGLRPEGGPIGYREALGQLHDTEDSAGGLGTAARLVGGGLTMAAVPGSATTKGAISGALHGFTDANPDADRRAETLEQGALGGALGAGAELAGAGASRVGSLIKSQAQKERDVLGAIRSAFQPKEATQDEIMSGLRSTRPVPSAPSAPERSIFGRPTDDLKDVEAVFGPPRARPVPSAPLRAAVSPVSSPPVASSPPTLDGLLAKMRTLQPNEVASKFGDAEVAMGHDQPAPDLADLLRRSIRAKGGTPVADLEASPAAASAPSGSLVLEPEATGPLKIRDEYGRIRRDLRRVPDEALGAEWQRLAEMNAEEEGTHAAVEGAGYRADYYELPRTEKFGRRGQEDLPDADGTVDPDVLARDNRTVSDFRRGALVRDARERLMNRIQEELASRPTATDFNFGANAQPQSAGRSAAPIN